MEDELLNKSQTVTGELINTLSSFNQQQFNKVPFEGSWTAGQLAEHVILANSGFSQLLKGPTKDTERAPDENVENLRSAFLNYNIKMQSPDFIRPEIKGYDKEELLNSITIITAEISASIKTLDLSKTCIARELPNLGFLTRLEAVYFVIFHTQRHVHQLKNIAQKILG